MSVVKIKWEVTVDNPSLADQVLLSIMEGIVGVTMGLFAPIFILSFQLRKLRDTLKSRRLKEPSENGFPKPYLVHSKTEHKPAATSTPKI